MTHAAPNIDLNTSVQTKIFRYGEKYNTAKTCANTHEPTCTCECACMPAERMGVRVLRVPQGQTRPYIWPSCAGRERARHRVPLVLLCLQARVLSVHRVCIEWEQSALDSRDKKFS